MKKKNICLKLKYYLFDIVNGKNGANKRTKKIKILEYLDKEAKLKEFKVEKFTIEEISIYLNLDKDEINELLEELIQEKSVYKDQFVYDAFLSEGEERKFYK